MSKKISGEELAKQKEFQNVKWANLKEIEKKLDEEDKKKKENEELRKVFKGEKK